MNISTAPPLFPINSAELLWSWHISTDTMTLSDGAASALNFGSGARMLSMSEFLTHVPAICLPLLLERREAVLNGTAGSRLETTYYFNDLEVSELMLVIARDSAGRATSVMGQHQIIAPTHESLPDKSEENSTVGIWLLSDTDGKCYIDRHAAALFYQPGDERIATLPKSAFLMPNAAPDKLGPLKLSRTAFLACLHPEDAQTVKEAYGHSGQFHCGETLEHDVRVRRSNGSYAFMKLCGSVLRANEKTKAICFAGTLTDVSTSVAVVTRNDLAQNDNRRLLYAVNSTGDGLWDWDATTNSVYFSPRYLSMIGYTADEFPGNLEVWAQKIHPDDHDKIINPQCEIVASPVFGDTFECTYRLMRKDGSWAWILGRGYVTHRNEAGRATRLVGMHTDVTTIQSEREKLESLIINDTLTGLRSRTYWDLEMQRIEKNHMRPVALITADINGLKLVNDTLGHTFGDKLLATAALLLREPMRATDCVARVGGDEFVIILPGCTQEKAENLLERLRACFQRHNAANPEVLVYAAFGLAFTDTPGISLKTTLRLADERMLREKRAARTTSLTKIRHWLEQKTDGQVPIVDSRLG